MGLNFVPDYFRAVIFWERAHLYVVLVDNLKCLNLIYIILFASLITDRGKKDLIRSKTCQSRLFSVEIKDFIKTSEFPVPQDILTMLRIDLDQSSTAMIINHIRA